VLIKRKLRNFKGGEKGFVKKRKLNNTYNYNLKWLEQLVSQWQCFWNIQRCVDISKNIAKIKEEDLNISGRHPIIDMLHQTYRNMVTNLLP